MNDYSIGDFIRACRGKIKISQEQLALKAEITPAYLGQIERNERNPTVKVIEKIAMVLNVSVSDFFKEYEVNNTNSTLDCEGESLVDRQVLFELKSFSPAQKDEVYKIVKAIAKIKEM